MANYMKPAPKITYTTVNFDYNDYILRSHDEAFEERLYEMIMWSDEPRQQKIDIIAAEMRKDLDAETALEYATRFVEDSEYQEWLSEEMEGNLDD